MKPENYFIKKVHKHIGSLYAEKMANPYRGGTPDVWYSGRSGDIWIEYKYLPTVPQRGTVRIALSALQAQWLRMRHEEGRKVAVIVGCPKGGVVMYGTSWAQPLPALDYQRRLMTVEAIGEHLRKNYDL